MTKMHVTQNTERPNIVLRSNNGYDQPQTEAWAPKEFLPQTPLLLPHAIPMLDSFTPAEGFEAADVDLSFADEVEGASFGAKP